MVQAISRKCAWSNCHVYHFHEERWRRRELRRRRERRDDELLPTKRRSFAIQGMAFSHPSKIEKSKFEPHSNSTHVPAHYIHSPAAYLYRITPVSSFSGPFLSARCAGFRRLETPRTPVPLVPKSTGFENGGSSSRCQMYFFRPKWDKFDHHPKTKNKNAFETEGQDGALPGDTHLRLRHSRP